MHKIQDGEDKRDKQTSPKSDLFVFGALWHEIH